MDLVPPTFSSTSSSFSSDTAQTSPPPPLPPPPSNVSPPPTTSDNLPTLLSPPPPSPHQQQQQQISPPPPPQEQHFSPPPPPIQVFSPPPPVEKPIPILPPPTTSSPPPPPPPLPVLPPPSPPPVLLPPAPVDPPPFTNLPAPLLSPSFTPPPLQTLPPPALPLSSNNALPVSQPPLFLSPPAQPSNNNNNNNNAATPSSSIQPLSPPISGSPSPPSDPSSALIPPPNNQQNQQTTPPIGNIPFNKDVATGAIAAGSVAALIVAVVAVVFFILKKRKKRIHGFATPPNSLPLTPDMYYASKPPGTSPIANVYSSFRAAGYHPARPESGTAMSWFTYEELKDITNGFSQENLLGEGGFGCVYKGCLADGKFVAVKQLKVGSGQGDREFKAEVEIISRVHHRHLVSLVGYCIDEHHRLLVYEYLPNKTLEYHLHGSDLPVLEWSKRVKIALGSARGLAYLHEDCHPRIIHRDIKSANILLDSSFEAQVADFGLAKLTNDSVSHVSTRVMGTFGYMAPEYASSGKLTDRSDVFSFGVVLLELITGRKPVDPSRPLGDESLVEWIRPLLVRALERGDCDEFVDPRLENNYVKSEMLLMIEAAAACVRHAASKRPRMVQVVRALDNEGDLSDLSNGMKFGQSTVYNSAQYSAEIRLFQRSGLESDDFSSSNFDISSGEHQRAASTFSGDS